MENIELRRDCNVVAIPSGTREQLPQGTSVRIVQTRGGNYTVSTQNVRMYRIDAADADALGLSASEPSQENRVPFSEQLVWDSLKTVYDPEIPVNIVDLGLIYACSIRSLENGKRAIDVQMSLTAPGCGMSEVLKADVESKLLHLPEVAEAHVKVTFDPPWTPDRMSEAARLQLGFDLDQPKAPNLVRLS